MYISWKLSTSILDLRRSACQQVLMVEKFDHPKVHRFIYVNVYMAEFTSNNKRKTLLLIFIVIAFELYSVP